MVRSSLFGRKVLVPFLLPLLLIGCATVGYSSDYEGDYYVNATARQHKWFPFLEVGKTQKEEIEQRLGQPHVRYEKGRIWTYRIILHRGPWVNTSGPYNLVLVFDERNILNKHSFLRDQL